MPSQELESFVQKVFDINPRYINVFGTGLPGMAGTAVSSQGMDTTGADVVNQLRRDAAQLLDNKLDPEQLAVTASQVEGHLMLLQTLGAISSELCQSLINELGSVLSK